MSAFGSKIDLNFTLEQLKLSGAEAGGKVPTNVRLSIELPNNTKLFVVDRFGNTQAATHAFVKVGDSGTIHSFPRIGHVENAHTILKVR